MTDATVITESRTSARPEPEPDFEPAIGRMLSEPSRRSFLASSLVPAGLASAMLGAVPAMADEAAVAIKDERHPDHGLFLMKQAWDEAEAEARAASRAHGAAYDELWDTVGPCPACLRVSDGDYGAMTVPWKREERRGIQFKYMSRFDDQVGDIGTVTARSEAWTPDALRKTILMAVPIFGKGGTTPFRIRHYRELLPIADVYFGRFDAVSRRLSVDDLAQRSREADHRRTQLSEDFSRMSATTLAGLAILAARMNTFSWEAMHASWRNLLRSAAAVSGVEMRGPRYDVERFIGRLERVGGGWAWDKKKDQGGLYWPIDREHKQWQRDELSELSREADEFRGAIREWMRDQAWAA